MPVEYHISYIKLIMHYILRRMHMISFSMEIFPYKILFIPIFVLTFRPYSQS